MAMDAAAMEILASMGLPGLVIAGLAWFCKRLMDENRELQEKRLDEMRMTITTIADVKNALQALTEVVKAFGRN